MLCLQINAQSPETAVYDLRNSNLRSSIDVSKRATNPEVSRDIKRDLDLVGTIDLQAVRVDHEDYYNTEEEFAPHASTCHHGNHLDRGTEAEELHIASELAFQTPPSASNGTTDNYNHIATTSVESDSGPAGVWMDQNSDINSHSCGEHSISLWNETDDSQKIGSHSSDDSVVTCTSQAQTVPSSTSDDHQDPAGNGSIPDDNDRYPHPWNDEGWEAAPKITLDNIDIVWKYVLMEKRWSTKQESGAWEPVCNGEFYNRNEANAAAKAVAAREINYGSKTDSKVQSHHYYSTSGLSGWLMTMGNYSVRIHVTRESMAPLSSTMKSLSAPAETSVVWEIVSTTIKSGSTGKGNSSSPMRAEQSTVAPIGALFDDLRMANERAQDIVSSILAPESEYQPFCVSYMFRNEEGMPALPFQASVVMDATTRILIEVRERSLECLDKVYELSLLSNSSTSQPVMDKWK